MDVSVTSAAVRIVQSLQPGDEAGFVSRRIAEKALHPLIADLNQDILSKDPARVRDAQQALRRLGFS
ncbi:MAG: hypothetical protein HLUCCA08_03970 [Rhodobacteraceae bacterium HLUCCA08]|nr:MAG: hypothetical protein HLUCCA08_03970 [Rhodobacteraceae bacterium HLUCCA08]